MSAAPPEHAPSWLDPDGPTDATARGGTVLSLRPDTLRGLAIGFAALLAALALHALLPRSLGTALPLATLVGAVAVAAWFGGWGPGLLTATLGFAASAWGWATPAGPAGASPASTALVLASYAFGCALIVGFGAARRRALHHLERAQVQRRAAESRAAAASDRLRVTLAAVGDGVIVVGATGRVVACNTVAQAQTGWREGDAIGRDLSEVLDSVDARGADPEPDAARSPRDHAEPIVDALGQRVGAVLVLRGAPAPHAVERLPTPPQLALHALLRSMPLAAVVVDAEPALVRCSNGAAERLFGWRADEVLGRPLPGVPLDKSIEARLQHERVRHGATLLDVETCRDSADGRRLALRLSAAPLCGADRRCTGTLLLFVDMTVLDAARVLPLDTREREHLAAAQAQAERRKDEQLATLAHELRNPLAPLRNGVQLLRMIGAGLPAAQRPLDIMERQIAQMVRLIDDLVDVGRLRGDALPLQRRRVDVSRVVQDAIETSQPLLEAGGHRLSVALPSQAVFVDADATRLCQVIANLLNNAAKFTPQPGSVRVSVERQGAEVGVAVEDDGRGIPDDMLPDIFDMFTQVGRGHHGAPGGLGIGLAIARRLVELHGGRLQAHSGGPGTGSRFLITLPVAAPPGEADALPHDPATPAVRPDTPAVHTGCRILVADDNDDAAESLSQLLALRGNETWIARDGVEAFELAKAVRPDIALLDIGMPRLDGYALARRLRDQPWGRDVRLVAVTGWGQDTDRQRSASAGFDLHWVKPVDPAALDALVAGVAAGKAAPDGAAH